MAGLGENWVENIQGLWREVSPLLTNLKTLDFKQLTTRDYLTLIGLGFTVAKAVFMGWQVTSAFKQYGVAKLVKPNLVKKYGTWAVVTAPEIGIGEAYCTELASCGLNIFMIPGTHEQCRPIAVYLEEKYKVETQIAKVDFSNCRLIYDQVQEQIGDREVGILVNNLDTSGSNDEDFTDLEYQEVSFILHMTLNRTSMMTHLVLPGMLERGRGAIVTLVPTTTGMSDGKKALYGACKNFMDYFAGTLNDEYKEQGITIQTLVPLLVAEKGSHMPSAMSLLVPSASSYAREAVSTLGWSEKSNGCFRHQVQVWLTGFMPSWLTKFIASGLSTFIQKQAGEKLGIDISEDTAKSFTNSIVESQNSKSPASLLDYLIY